MARKADEVERLKNFAWLSYMENDYEQAFDAFKELSELGDAEATTMLGVLYRDTNFVGIDYDKAAQYFLRAIELGDVSAYYELGRMYNCELDNGARAIEYLQRATILLKTKKNLPCISSELNSKG